MHISNPITPRATELRQAISVEEVRIKKFKEIRSNADTELSKVMNENIDWSLDRLEKFRKELEKLNESEKNAG